MSGSPRIDIRSLSMNDIAAFINKEGEAAFRTRQIYRWLWKDGVRSVDQMTNLPLSLKEILSRSFDFLVTDEDVVRQSTDGTIKVAFRLHDGILIEGVLIPTEERTTACISSQAGCALGCLFCATGLNGFYRNLTAQEMFDQIWLLNARSISVFKRPLSNIVLMGMGEPLYNYKQVSRMIHIITDPKGWGLSPHRITLSTVGVPKMIKQLTDDKLPVHLAISLHAASDELRGSLIPFNNRHPLQDLSEALRYYVDKSGNRFTIEYLLIRDTNDSVYHAGLLADFCRSFPVKINIIEYNPVPGLPFQRAEIKRMKAFRDFLESKNMVVNVRQSRGKDIDAACGQLAGKQP